MLNDKVPWQCMFALYLVLAIPWQCLSALSMFILWYLWQG